MKCPFCTEKLVVSEGNERMAQRLGATVEAMALSTHLTANRRCPGWELYGGFVCPICREEIQDWDVTAIHIMRYHALGDEMHRVAAELERMP